MRAKTIGLLAVMVGPGIPVPAARAQVIGYEERQRQIQGRDHSAAELRQMLAELPPDPVFCATGHRWYNFTSSAPHTPRTVAALRQLFTETKDPRNLQQLLWALNPGESVALGLSTRMPWAITAGKRLDLILGGRRNCEARVAPYRPDFFGREVVRRPFSTA